MRKRVLTGIKPTGDLHLGNYVGAIKPCVQFSKDPNHEVLLMCADWHGLTDRNKILEPGETTIPILAAMLVLGYETTGNALFLQSDFRQIQEVGWYLSCVAAVGMLERAHAYKDALANNKKPTGGLFYYPVLMAADIVTFDSDLVPVGKDQAQHLEYMDDFVGQFNHAVNKPGTFKAAKPLIHDTEPLIGIDGERKMSKSYNNHIPLFGSKKEVEKRIKEIKTDSKGLNDPKDPSTCPIYLILKHFGSKEAIADMEQKLKKGTGYGYGHAKQDFLSEYERVFGSKREEYEHLTKNPKEVWKRMEPAYSRITGYADTVVQRAREALGLVKFR